MSKVVVWGIVGAIFFLCLVCTIATLKKVEGVKDKITTIVPILGVIVTMIPYIFPVGNDNGVAMYYGDLEAFKDIQENYTEIVNENSELSLTVKNQEQTISDLKNQIKGINQGESGEIGLNVGDDGVDFQDVADILYSGAEYEKFDGTTNEGFAVGGKDYRTGFTIYNDGGLFDTTGSAGYVLFNLEEQYKTMVCNVGRVNSGTDNETLYITSSDGVVDMQFEVRSDASSQVLEIPLNYAKDLKIALNTEMHVKCGFFDIKFYK